MRCSALHHATNSNDGSAASAKGVACLPACLKASGLPASSSAISLSRSSRLPQLLQTPLQPPLVSGAGAATLRLSWHWAQHPRGRCLCCLHCCAHLQRSAVVLLLLLLQTDSPKLLPPPLPAVSLVWLLLRSAGRPTALLSKEDMCLLPICLPASIIQVSAAASGAGGLSEAIAKATASATSMTGEGCGWLLPLHERCA